MRSFNNDWGVRGMARGAVVVVLSDGWDRGDPGLLGQEMERLHRITHELIWVNPLKATPGYAPLAAGMAAALPHVDRFVEGHSFASLDQLAAVLAGDQDRRGSAGRSGSAGGTGSASRTADGEDEIGATSQRVAS
jgi:uncharacterized protein with von Willebrand factor type A (vWA) domain